MKIRYKKYTILVLAITFIITNTGCEKYLEAKPDKKLVVPSTLQDIQALLDFGPATVADPGCDEVSADNFYLTTSNFLALDLEGDRRMYTWEKDNIFQTSSNDWSLIYNRVYYVNTVLDALNTIERTPQNQAEWDHVKGQALLLRGKSFLLAAIIWAKVYDEATAETDFGIPLKLRANLTDVSTRASLGETFRRIFSDLKESVRLLPDVPVHVSRSSRPAAYGYLSRAYLYMRKYQEAGRYADSCLKIKSSLMDYNQLSVSATYPVPMFNIEEVMYGGSAPVALDINYATVDSNLYRSFADNDLRKQIFFKSSGNGTFQFKGSYDGSFGGQFTGIGVDEAFLTRAECFAREGNTQKALEDLNALMITRWKTGTFIPFNAANAAEALTIILRERRKQLMFRSIRFMDIKRLNKEGANIVQQRNVNGQTYTLPPNDLRYALPIPELVISISGMQQNPR